MIAVNQTVNYFRFKIVTKENNSETKRLWRMLKWKEVNSRQLKWPIVLFFSIIDASGDKKTRDKKEYPPHPMERRSKSEPSAASRNSDAKKGASSKGK